MKSFLVSALTLFSGIPLVVAHAQVNMPAVRVDVAIDTRLDTGRISPYIYGSNGEANDRDLNIGARRMGGNRLTGYNWENNASNAGNDYIHHSDNYLTMNLPDAVQNTPGIALTSFHDTSLSMGAYTLLTLPGAGYVAKDKNGTVTPEQSAPSSRWVQVKAMKGAPLSLAPDLGDNYVYVDEEVNFLVDKYGDASTSRGVKGYCVDNEPALWPTTHPRLHPNKPTVQEVIAQGIDIAKSVKSVDPHAEVFGPVSYGYAEYLAMQDASDWNSYKSYGTFLGAYLAKLKQAGQEQGMRLLDVLDLHWYPEALGKRDDGGYERIAMSENTDDSVAYARIQAPRTLWDSSYTENSWIGQYFSPVALVPQLNATIATYYPGTKLAFTELNYGGATHISGGIAMADVLGIFGKYGVYMSNYWGEINGYLSSAYKIYRNYDGARSTFGDMRVSAACSDHERASAYASVESAAPGKLHVLLINKNQHEAMEAHIALANQQYDSASVFTFTEGRPQIQMEAILKTSGKSEIIYTLPPLTVAHLVFAGGAKSGVADEEHAAGFELANHPNPASERTTITYSLPERAGVRLALYDMLGREVMPVAAGEREAGRYSVEISTKNLAAGAYLCRMQVGGKLITRKMEVR